MLKGSFIFLLNIKKNGENFVELVEIDFLNDIIILDRNFGYSF